ncbi:type IV secretory system conjugative DNA transfer family protein, partial [Lachnospiraceae bacterium PAL227]
MQTKKQTPYLMYSISLLVFLIIGYYVGAFYVIPGANFGTINETIRVIATNPFANYINEKTPAMVGLFFVLWIMFVSYYAYHYRNFYFHKEHGCEEWGDVKKLCRVLADKDESKNRIVSKNMKISKRKLSNNNMLVIGPPGTYKTTSIIIPNLLQAANTYVVLDVKGELMRTTGNYLKEKGFDIRSLNLKEPWKSDRYNPFHWIVRENDLIRLITNLHESVRKPEAMQSEPFWDDGVDLYLQALFFYEWLEAKEEKRTGSMNNILKLVNMETKKVDDKTTQLQFKMNKLAKEKGADYPPVRDYRKLKEGATETVRSIVIMVNAMLKLCETADIKRIFSGNDIDMRALGLGIDGNPHRKTALFLVLPDNDKSYNFLISLFYTQMFDTLMRVADDEIKGPLPIEVEVMADEFYSGPKPSNPDELLGV